MSKSILIAGGLLIIGLGGFFLFQSSNEKPAEEGTMPKEIMQKEIMPGDKMPMMAEHTVVYSDGGYSPKELTIKKGDKVTFRNESARETWPASAIHPSHSAYPGSGIQKCETEERMRIFDACMGLKQGEEWSFVFDKVGTWGYHDHLRPDMFGKIIVQE